jgi:hypothetical protein
MRGPLVLAGVNFNANKGLDMSGREIELSSKGNQTFVTLSLGPGSALANVGKIKVSVPKSAAWNRTLLVSFESSTAVALLGTQFTKCENARGF